ncbi:hypothetical protein D3C73_1037330 [compost metagenome]
MSLEFGHQLVQQALDPPDVARQLVILDVTLHQHHTCHAVFEALLRQKGVGQQIAVLLITAGDAARGFDQVGDAAFPAKQRLVQRGQLAEWIDCPAFDLQGFDCDLGAHQQWLGLGRTGFRHLQGGSGRTVGIGRQVGNGKVADRVVAVEEAGKCVCEGAGTEAEQKQ